ncbi:MAG: CPBP family intramembrane metalloprotease [Tannerella sp.]|jgi:membrane protease YdiL (CAAX protease family)|nr:CPBP family intramembrane metalloprotease [Tannerella sp.]
MKTSYKENLKVFGCFIGFYILDYFLFRYAISLVNTRTPTACVAAVFMMVTFAVLVFLLYLRMFGKETFRVRDISRKNWLRMFLLCVSQFFIVSLLYGYPVWNYFLFSPDSITAEEYFLPGHVIFFLSGVFCIPVVQEVLLRGFLQKQLSRYLAPWLSVSIVTLVSIIYAGITPNILPVLCTGIFGGIIYHKTDKLILCIIFQGLYSVMFGITRPSVKYVDVWLITFFILAAVLAVYAIRGFMKEKALPVKTNP